MMPVSLELIIKGLPALRKVHSSPPVSKAMRRGLCTLADDERRAAQFIQSRGFPLDVAQAVVDKLKHPDWGGKQGQVLQLAQKLAGRWEVGEDAGLSVIANAVQQELAAKEGKQLLTMWVQPSAGERPFACKVREGMSIRDVCVHSLDDGARLLGEYLECACSGVAACSTCHVYVDERYAPPTSNSAT